MLNLSYNVSEHPSYYVNQDLLNSYATFASSHNDSRQGILYTITKVLPLKLDKTFQKSLKGAVSGSYTGYGNWNYGLALGEAMHAVGSRLPLFET